MKVLLDECVDPALASEFQKHQAESALQAGMTSLSNGELLRACVGRFDAFVTVDKGILYQQNLTQFDLVFVLLKIGSNRVDQIRPYIDAIESFLDAASAGDVRIIGRD